MVEIKKSDNKNIFWSFIISFFTKKVEFTPINEEKYFERFKIVENDICNKEILEKAYTKAWENRNFEIDKFWVRAAYFWGFIVLIFGGYITLLTSEHNQKAIDMNIDLYLLLLGFLFSLSWYLVICGSKRWQENWEAHIEKLENYISGPLYKTIYYSGKNFYSVSKLNEVMALVVIIVWCCFILNYVIDNNLILVSDIELIDFQITLSIFTTIIFALVLRFGYCKGKYKLNSNTFFVK